MVSRHFIVSHCQSNTMCNEFWHFLSANKHGSLTLIKRWLCPETSLITINNSKRALASFPSDKYCTKWINKALLNRQLYYWLRVCSTSVDSSLETNVFMCNAFTGPIELGLKQPTLIWERERERQRSSALGKLIWNLTDPSCFKCRS